jgi:hypothetical protein
VYSYASVVLPLGKLALQPIILIVNKVLCQDCLEKSVSLKAIREYRNKAHGKKRVPNKDIF